LLKIKLIGFSCSLFILVACAGSSSTPNLIDTGNIENINKRLNQQKKQINIIEQKLISYQTEFDDLSLAKDEISQLKHILNNELRTTLDKLSTDSIEEDIIKILNTLQNKIQILEDRTFYTDSLYFSIVNDIVLMENKFSSLILSFKEMKNLSVNKTTQFIPKITDEEYTSKYIESLSHYQNGEWDSSLDGFNYLIRVNTNHDLSDNCQYWIGEVYYALIDYRRSIEEFGKVFSFPGTNKSDDAQFKIGLCYLNIGQIDKAKQEFNNLLELYPNSEYYRKAQDYLRQN